MSNRKKISDIRTALLKTNINQIELEQNKISGINLQQNLKMDIEACKTLLKEYKSVQQCGDVPSTDVNNNLHDLFKNNFSVEIDENELYKVLDESKIKVLQDLLDLSDKILNDFDNGLSTLDTLKNQFFDLKKLNDRNIKCINNRIIYKYNCIPFHIRDKKHDRAIKWTFIYEQISSTLLSMLTDNINVRIKNQENIIKKNQENIIKQEEKEANKKLKDLAELRKAIGLPPDQGGGSTTFNFDKFWEKEFQRIENLFTPLKI